MAIKWNKRAADQRATDEEARLHHDAFLEVATTSTPLSENGRRVLGRIIPPVQGDEFPSPAAGPESFEPEYDDEPEYDEPGPEDQARLERLERQLVTLDEMLASGAIDAPTHRMVRARLIAKHRQ